MIAILNIFTHIGQSKSISDAYSSLIALYPNDPYAKQKAAGSLGGASKSGFIKLINGNWTRVR